MKHYFDNVIDNQLAISLGKLRLSRGAQHSVKHNIIKKAVRRSQPRGEAYHRLLYIEDKAVYQ
jgi:hypothetical protein